MNKKVFPDGFILNFSVKKYETPKNQTKPCFFVTLSKKIVKTPETAGKSFSVFFE